VHLDLIVKILLAGFLRVFERRLCTLYQRVAVAAVNREPRKSGLERGADITPLDAKRFVEDRPFEEDSHALCRGLRLRQHEHERAAADIAEALVVLELMLETVSDSLQQQIADVPAKGAVDLAQVHDIERNDRRPSFRHSPAA